jgi:hypothetical protein
MLKRLLLFAGMVIRWIFLVSGSLLLLEEYIRVIIYVAGQWGLSHIFVDSAVVYKTGELLIAIPFFLFVHGIGNWDKNRMMSLVKRGRWLIVAGATLNGLAWIDLHRRIDWSWWNLALLFFGLTIPWLLRRWNEKQAKWRSRFLATMFSYAHSYIMSGYLIVPIPSSPPFPASSDSERWQQDLQYLASELPRMHVDAFHAVGQDEFRKAVADLYASIPRLRENQILAGMMRMVAMIGDAHTSFQPMTISDPRIFPLRLEWFSDGLYVVQAAEPYSRALATRVKAIAHTDIDSAYALIAPLISHENNSWLRISSPKLFVSPSILEALDILEKDQPSTFTLEDTIGNIFATEISAMNKSGKIVWINAADKLPLYRQRPTEEYWFKYFEDSKTLYFKYNLCLSPIAFPRFVSQIWEFVDSNSVDRLIVDLRGNHGGYSEQFNPFLSNLKTHPDINQIGHLFVAIDGGTFSSAVINAVDLRVQSAAIFVGQTMGENPNSYGEVRSFALPNSRLRVNYSTKFFKLLADSKISTFPDIFIEPSFRDYAAGKDPVMDTIMAYRY